MVQPVRRQSEGQILEQTLLHDLKPHRRLAPGVGFEQIIGEAVPEVMDLPDFRLMVQQPLIQGGGDGKAAGRKQPGHLGLLGALRQRIGKKKVFQIGMQ